ncbi:MAG: hypothetical protein J0I80_11380 [Sphingomonas sp.]|nr:hypothetical protein [Sphingomonas sp.]
MTQKNLRILRAKNAKKIGQNRPKKRSKSENSNATTRRTRERNPSSRSTTGSKRTTVSLSTAQVRLIQNAVDHADRIGLPLNRMITVDWTLAGITDPQASRQHLLGLIYDWMRSRGHASAHVWVMENGPRHGVHSHVLMHVPPSLRKDFNRLFRSWRKQVGIPWKRYVVHSRHVGLTANAAFAKGDRASYLHNAHAATAYILKAASASARRSAGLSGRYAQFSEVVGKRCGTSRNLGESAIQWFQARSRDVLGV